MSTIPEAALDAAEEVWNNSDTSVREGLEEIILAALAKMGEPIAWRVEDSLGVRFFEKMPEDWPGGSAYWTPKVGVRPLFAAPPVEMMTDAEIDNFIAECGRPEDVFPYVVPLEPKADPVKEKMAEALKVTSYYYERNPPFGLGFKRIIDEALAAYVEEKAKETAV